MQHLPISRPAKTLNSPFDDVFCSKKWQFRVRTYRHGPKCQKHVQVANAAIHVHGKVSRSKGQIRSIFFGFSTLAYS